MYWDLFCFLHSFIGCGIVLLQSLFFKQYETVFKKSIKLGRNLRMCRLSFVHNIDKRFAELNFGK